MMNEEKEQDYEKIFLDAGSVLLEDECIMFDDVFVRCGNVG